MSPGLLNAGDLDPTFGSGGIVTTSVSSSSAYATAVLSQFYPLVGNARPAGVDFHINLSYPIN